MVISKIVTTWWFSFLRLLIASTISSWMCLAHLSSYFLSSASSLKKKSCLSLISPPLTPLNLSHYCLVILYAIILSLALFVLPPPLPRPQDGPLILVHGFSLVKVGKVLDSPVGHTFNTYPLHLYLNFLSLFNSTESFQSFLAFSNDGQASSCWFQYTVFRFVSIWCPHWFFSWSIFLSCPDCLVYGSVVAHW